MDILQRYYDEFDDMKLTTEEMLIVDDMIKEIERLKKENEWLIELMYKEVVETSISLKAYKHAINSRIQQALKELS